MYEFLLIGLVFLTAAFVHGICGFGFSVLSISVLSLLIGPKTAVPLDLIVASVNCFYLAWLMRKHILYKETILLALLALVCLPLGTIYLRFVDSSIIIRSLGLLVILVASISLLKAEHLRIFSSKPYQYMAGITGGLLAGAFNIAGPPLVLYAYNCHWKLVNAKANLQFLFSVTTLMGFASFTAAGLLNWQIVGRGLLYAPIVIAFSFAGAWIASRMNTRQLTIAVNLLLLMLGITLIIKG